MTEENKGNEAGDDLRSLRFLLLKTAIRGPAGRAGLLLINIHAGGREIQPDDLGGQPLEVRGAFVVPVAEMIAVLNPFAAVLQNRADLFGERIGFIGREIQQRQTGNDRADAFNRFVVLPQQNVKMPRVAGDDVGAGKAQAEQARQLGIVFNGHQPLLAQAVFDERLGDRSGAGAEFEHETFRVGRQPARHRGGEFGRTGCDGAGPLRIGEPFLQKQGRVGQCRDELFGHDVENFCSTPIFRL